MSRNRGHRAGGADLYARRQSERVTVDADGEEPDDIAVIDEPEEYEDDERVVLAPDGEAEEHEDDAEDDPLGDLEQQLATLKKRTETVEAENATLKQHQRASEADVLLAQEAALGQSLRNAQGVSAAAERALADAIAKQDATAIAKAQRAIVRAEQDVVLYENAISEHKAEVEAFKRKPKQEQRQQPADRYADPDVFHPETRKWLLKHRDDIENQPKRQARAIAGHHMAVADGIEENSAEYFAYLDKHMGYGEPEVTTKRRERPAAAEKRVAAPAGSRGGSSKREVHLTAAERQAAASMGMSTAQYAKNKLAIEENGRKNSDGLRFYRDSNQGRAHAR